MSASPPGRPPSADDAPLLSPDDLCGRSLLALASAGHGTAARIRSLSGRVPLPYWAASGLPPPGRPATGSTGAGQRRQQRRGSGPTQGEGGGLFNLFGTAKRAAPEGAAADGTTGGDELGEAGRYAPFLFDFNYLHNPEEHEASLLAGAGDDEGGDGGPAGPDLEQLEREFTVNQSRTVVEFYGLFEDVVRYHSDLSSFVDDLNRGYYIRHTVESVLSDEDGRRLVCEAVYLWGVLLITMEHYLPVSFTFEDGGKMSVAFSGSVWLARPPRNLETAFSI